MNIQNGTYKCRLLPLGDIRKIIICNGVIKVYSFDTGSYLRTLTPLQYKEHYEVITKLKTINVYHIGYYVHSKLHQTIHLNGNYSLALWKISELKKLGLYRTGKLIPIKI